MMKVQLLVSEWCASCHQAEKIWRSVAEERSFDFEVVDMGQPEGKALVSRLRLRSIPALVIDGELKGIGVQRREDALRLVEQAPPKAAGAVRHVGLGLEPTSRLAILSSVAYLVMAGAWLPFAGGLLVEGAGRPAPLHIFTLGFVVFMLYGLGEHMLPRFTGNPICLGLSAWAQFVLAHVGVAAMAAGFWWAVFPVTITGAVAAWLALLVFLARLWPVLWRTPAEGKQPAVDLHS